MKAYLLGQGVPETQLRTVSYGEAANRLVAPRLAGNREGAEANRRVALVIDTRPTSGGVIQ